jgi:tetratricopeptide (TPR) repeat protein
MDIEVECRRETAAAQVIGRLNQALAEQLVTPLPRYSEITAITERTTREAQRQMPLLLTPRNTLVANSRPPFRWQPIPDVSGYRLSVTLAGGETWEREISDTSLPYPDDVPRLVVGGANIVELTTLDDETGEAVDKTSVRLLAGGSMTELFEARDAIRALDLDEVAKRFILAQLYRRRALWTAAISELEQLTQAHNLTSANLWQQLGDLYAEVGLYVLAEESYNQALTFAESEQNPGAQAAAQVGLARTALVFGESEQTIGFLTAAENLYRMARQDELANGVKAELAELK